ncbi:restriction endonuclease [Methylobacterium sp. SI9]|uniref:restriction endonuclease n=1 Tax=Methylobacterium guangdongense TaxID=3138811 RepID=UPI00313DC935
MKRQGKGPNSNKIRGDAFRDRLRDICIAAGYSPIKESKENGKDVDLCFEVFRVPKPVRIAIEAKYYHQNLGRRLIDEIIGSYKNAIERRIVDEVWVVSSSDFSADARDTLNRNSGFYALTYEDFIRGLINFPKYIEQLRLEIEHDGISEYYVDQFFESGTLAVEHLLKWHSGNLNRPAAVLSTYGMGKSSLAKVFAYKLTEQWRKDPLNRIPILIRLGDLSAQQRIDGLLGSIFTSDLQVSGYSFPLFQKLNNLGYLTLILDGLDEMRYAMRWDDFNYNFSQLKILITQNTKCIMLGRPNTFQNAREYKAVIEGSKYIGNLETKAAGALEFERLDLMPFQDKDIDEFFIGYLRKFFRKSPSITEQTIKARVAEIRSLNLDGLFSRPVHAKMMADIASDLKISLKKFTRYELYDAFIETILTRDFDRHKGVGLSSKDRRTFLANLALDSFFNEREHFTISQINLEIYRDFVKENDADGILRELMSGSLIETKLGDVFHFSHRSFQEFLIADKISTAPAECIDILASRGITNETIDFIADNPSTEKVFEVYNLICSRKYFSVYLYHIISQLYRRLAPLKDELRSNPKTLWSWLMAVSTMVQIDRPQSVQSVEKYFALLNGVDNVKSDAYSPLFIQQLIAIAENPNDENSSYDVALTGGFLKYCLTELPFSRLLKNPSSVYVIRNEDGIFAKAFAETCFLQRSKEGNLQIVTNIVDSEKHARYIKSEFLSYYIARNQSSIFDLDELGPQKDPSLTALRRLVASSKDLPKFVVEDRVTRKPVRR